MKLNLRLTAAALLLAGMASTATLAAQSSVTNGFDGLDLTRAITFGQGFIPPDTMGAVGATQFTSILNGGYAVYDKATGAELQAMSTETFWRNAGATSFAGSFTGGDPRILYNAQANRWVATAFGGDTSYLNIAVSDTADATGPWRATTFLAYNGISGGGVADYATLAFDRNAVYIGTNDFDTGFKGTTLHVIPLSDVFGAGAPNVANRAQFVTTLSDPDHGFAIQGVNSNAAGNIGKIVADSRDLNDNVAYTINNPQLGAGATQGPVSVLNVPYICCYQARQPDGTRNLDTVGARTGSSAWEHNGKIYYTTSVAVGAVNGDQVVRVTVLDATTLVAVQQLDIQFAGYDTYMPSLAVSSYGVVVGYNRSGFNTVDGNISFLANAYTLDANGLLVFDATHILKVSANNGYHLGSTRNRWGDYSAVTLDPTDSSKFWGIGEYANFRDQQGNDGWATWISEISFAKEVVPEPASWAMMITGFGMIGGALRRRRSSVVAA